MPKKTTNKSKDEVSVRGKSNYLTDDRISLDQLAKRVPVDDLINRIESNSIDTASIIEVINAYSQLPATNLSLLQFAMLVLTLGLEDASDYVRHQCEQGHSSEVVRNLKMPQQLLNKLALRLATNPKILSLINLKK